MNQGGLLGERLQFCPKDRFLQNVFAAQRVRATAAASSAGESRQRITATEQVVGLDEGGRELAGLRPPSCHPRRRFLLSALDLKLWKTF